MNMLIALVDTLKQLRYQIAHLDDGTLHSEYPQLDEFLQALTPSIPTVTSELKFLYLFLYVYGRKSESTFNRFRNEIERFHLWSWLIAKKSVFNLKREDIEMYVEFVIEPENLWVSDSVQWRYKENNGQRTANVKWRPFLIKTNRISQQTISSMFTALNVFYKFAILEEKTFTNFVPVVKKN